MADHVDSNRSDWSWLQDTYWYVLREDLPALQLDPENNTLSWIIDQTVWHITGYGNGYFWGASATMTRKSEDETQQGQAHLGFVSECLARSRQRDEFT